MAESNLVSELDIRSKDPDLVAGPGSRVDAGIAPVPLLQGASEYEYVELLNPLSVEFIGMFGVSRPVQSPVNIGVVPGRGATKSENDLRNNYGLDLNNPDHPGRANIVNRVSIKSGQTVRLLGNEAQVVVKQLVNEIMQREGNKLRLSDGHARREVEERIIISRGSVADILGRGPISIHDQLQAAIKQEEPHEEAFPTIRNDAPTASATGEPDLPKEHPSGQPGDGDKNPKAKAEPAKK